MNTLLVMSSPGEEHDGGTWVEDGASDGGDRGFMSTSAVTTSCDHGRSGTLRPQKELSADVTDTTRDGTPFTRARGGYAQNR